DIKELDLSGNLLSEWKVELLRQSLTTIEELHIIGNNISRILMSSPKYVGLLREQFNKQRKLAIPSSTSELELLMRDLGHIRK
ncbi:hypothetical protein L195_g039416, partial [Trifolium pratense]